MTNYWKKTASIGATLLLGSSLVLGSAVSAQESGSTLPYETSNNDESIEGGVLRYALTGDPFAGVLNMMVYNGSPDGTIISLFNEGLFSYDENFLLNNDGFADLEFDQENKQVTITIPEGQKWDDGEDITIDDVIFPYYVIGHADYTGVRYGEDFKNVVGMEEYHNGEAEEISGLERVDDYTLRITYINFPNSMLQAGGGVSSYMEPEHILGDIPVAELEDSDAVRVNPVGFGPFKVVNVVPGESVTYEANPYYWRGQVKLDGLQLDVVSTNTVVAEMQAGNYDIAALPADQYEVYRDAENFEVLGAIANSYAYIGFKLGTMEDGTSVMDESRVQSNKALRQAMAYAIDNDAVGERFYYGLRWRANSPITPNFTEYRDETLEGYPQDVEKAKQLLADAGFVDNDGDGYVEDLNGEPFTLGFAAMTGGETAQPLAEYYIQQWAEIGVHVELVDGQLMEFNAFYEAVQNDDPKIDVFQGNWGIGGDPNPQGLYGREDVYNFTRFASEENDALMAAINSDESFDADFRKQAYVDWQAYYMDQVPLIPTLFRSNVYAVNNRVKNYAVNIGNPLTWADVELTADAPY